MSEPSCSPLLICGWNDQGRRMLSDLREVLKPTELTLICQPHEALESVLKDFPELHHIDGDPTNNEDLLAGGVEAVDVVLVLSDQSLKGSQHTLDARTILTILTIREVSPDVHIIAEVNCEENVDLAIHAGVDEWLRPNQFSGVMLSQAVQSSGLSELFTQLFETGAGTAFRYRPLPQNYLDLPFHQAVERTMAEARGALVGVESGGALRLPPDADYRLQEGDQLLLVERI